MAPEFGVCMACESQPCACPTVELQEGRYSYKPNHQCLECFTVPCKCDARSTDSSEDSYCRDCFCVPCICYYNPPDIDCPCGSSCKKCSLLTEDNWSHRSQEMRCSSCMWFVEKRDGERTEGEQRIGRCRRHAPTMNGYPVVYDMDWCGDHKLDETKI